MQWAKLPSAHCRCHAGFLVIWKLTVGLTFVPLCFLGLCLCHPGFLGLCRGWDGSSSPRSRVAKTGTVLCLLFFLEINLGGNWTTSLIYGLIKSKETKGLKCHFKHWKGQVCLWRGSFYTWPVFFNSVIFLAPGGPGACESCCRGWRSFHLKLQVGVFLFCCFWLLKPRRKDVHFPVRSLALKSGQFQSEVGKAGHRSVILLLTKFPTRDKPFHRIVHYLMKDKCICILAVRTFRCWSCVGHSFLFLLMCIFCTNT